MTEHDIKEEYTVVFSGHKEGLYVGAKYAMDWKKDDGIKPAKKVKIQNYQRAADDEEKCEWVTIDEVRNEGRYHIVVMENHLVQGKVKYRVIPVREKE